MAEAPAREGEEEGPRPAVDLTGSASVTPEGFSFSFSLKIADVRLAAGALVGIGCGVALAAFLYRNPELTATAVRGALEGPGLQVVSITPGSILVDLYCYTKESFLSFVKDLETEKVKQRLEDEFQKVGFKEELEVTITNDKEVYEKLDEIRQLESTLQKEKDETPVPTEAYRKAKYDVFICYNSKDRDWVRELLTQLEERGYTCFLAFRDLRPGDNWENVCQAIVHSRKTIVVLSPDFVDSECCHFELRLALPLALKKERSHQLVPVVYKKCTIPRILRGRNYLDWENFRVKSHFWDALEEALRLPNEAGAIVPVCGNPFSFQDDDHSNRKEPRGSLTPPPEDTPDDKTKYDVFICYSSKDWDWVRELLTELEKRSYSCFIDRRDFLPGMPIAENIAQAIDGSKKTVVVLSPDFVSSKWCNYELEMAYLQESGQSYHQVVPIVYRKCTIPRILQGKSYLDWENRKRNVWDALEKALSLPAPKDYDQTKDIPVSDRKYKYDVFICYSPKDISWVKKVLAELEKRSFSCWIDSRDFDAGVSSKENISKAIECSRKMVVVLSPDFVAGNWSSTELQLALSTISSRHIVPILYKKCAIPLVLRGRTYLDWENSHIKSYFWFALEKALRSPNDRGMFISNVTLGRSGAEPPCVLI